MRVGKGKLKLVVDGLVAGLDVERHASAIAVLRGCRTRDQLDALSGRWLSREPEETLRLVCHGQSTYLVVHYEEGWTRRLAMIPWPV